MVAHTRTPLRTDRLRALNLPTPVTVHVDEAGVPTHIEGLSEQGGSIAEIVETWRIDDEWWREPISRRYVDVVLDGGKHVVLFEDLHTGQWHVQMP